MILLTELDHEFSKFCFFVINSVNKCRSSEISKEESIITITEFAKDANFDEFNLHLSPKFVEGIFNLIFQKFEIPDRFPKRLEIPARLKGMRNRPCAYCGKPNPTDIDHIWPRALGGPDYHPANMRYAWNFVQSCSLCNRLKSFAPLSCSATESFLASFRVFCESAV
jgi:hypothetical protein